MLIRRGEIKKIGHFENDYLVGVKSEKNLKYRVLGEAEWKHPKPRGRFALHNVTRHVMCMLLHTRFHKRINYAFNMKWGPRKKKCLTGVQCVIRYK